VKHLRNFWQGIASTKLWPSALGEVQHFAIASIRHWLDAMGRERYATRRVSAPGRME
jgi:hypothetical protein